MNINLRDLIERIKVDLPVSDEEFDTFLPEKYRIHSNQHFTSIYISKLASKFLSDSNSASILDIGSGTGKFCLVGASITRAFYTGIEIRKDACEIARSFADELGILNVSFLNEDVLNLDFSEFTGFYMFNPFLEYVDSQSQMDVELDVCVNTVNKLEQYVYNQLSQSLKGTKLVTYYTKENQVPPSFKLIDSKMGGTLKFFVKD